MKAEIPTSTPTVAVPDDRTARPEEAMEPKAAVRTKEFWLVWVGMCFNCAGAYGLLSCAKPMLMDVFAQPLPGLVTGAFAAAFVSAISFFNLSGRVAWGAVSDAVGTRKTTMMLWGLGIPAYAAMPLAAHLAHDPALATVAAYAPLGVFLAGVMLAISTFGGSAAVSPAYLSDLFGKKHVAAIHGQLLSFLLIAGYLGPMLLSTLSAHAARKAIDGLAAQVPDDVFLTTFGSPRSELPALIDAKTVTIPRLLELLPGTVDPTPFLYDEPLLVIAGLQLAALACALAIRSMPVAKMGLIKKPIIPKPPKNSAAVPPAAAAAAAAAKK
jgi:MFS family permease